MQNPHKASENKPASDAETSRAGASNTMVIASVAAAIVLGWIIGCVVNFGFILLGFVLIPLPEGVDGMDAESIAEGIHLFGPQHFVFPLLAHAAGTLVGAIAGHLLAVKYRDPVAYVVGLLFFAGSIVNATMIPHPVWFLIVDLTVAYFPMAYLATRIGYLAKPRKTNESSIT